MSFCTTPGFRRQKKVTVLNLCSRIVMFLDVWVFNSLKSSRVLKNSKQGSLPLKSYTAVPKDRFPSIFQGQQRNADRLRGVGCNQTYLIHNDLLLFVFDVNLSHCRRTCKIMGSKNNTKTTKQVVSNCHPFETQAKRPSGIVSQPLKIETTPLEDGCVKLG